VWSGIVVSPVECAIDGMVVCALNGSTVGCALDDVTLIFELNHSLFLVFFLEVDFVDMLGTVQVSAVAGDMIYRSLTGLPIIVIDEDDMEHLPRPRSLTRLPLIVIHGDDVKHLPRPNLVVYPAVSNSVMERRKSRNIGVYRAMTALSCETITSPLWLTVTLLSSPSSMTIR